MPKRTSPPIDPETPEQQPSEVAEAVSAVVAHGLREPRVERWVSLEGLPDFQIRAWLNHPWRLRQDLISGDAKRFHAAFRQVVLEHNGWLDGAGEPYPSVEADPAAFWNALSTPLARTMLRSIYTEANALGNFPMPTPKSTATG
jgi:hypothetical protein